MSSLLFEQQTAPLVAAVSPPTQTSPGEGQARTVSMSADGQWLATGSMEDGNLYTGTGSVIIYRRTGDVWAEHQVIPGPLGQADQVYAVDISGDGSTLVVGTAAAYSTDVELPGGGDSISQPGSAWVYTKDGGDVWSLDTEILDAGRTDFARYGDSVAVNHDGTRAVVGAPSDGLDSSDFDPENITGNAYIWHLITGTWTNMGAVQGTGYTPGPGDPAGAGWGTAVEISGDGDTLLSNGRFAGTTWVWVWNGSAWEEQDLIGVADTVVQFDGYGLSFDGNTALIPQQNANTFTGYVNVWVRTAGVWANTDTFVAAEAGPASSFGQCALSADGLVAAVGAYTHDDEWGGFWVFRDTGSGWVQQGGQYGAADWDDTVNVGNPNGTIYPATMQFGKTTDISDDGTYIAVGAPKNDNIAEPNPPLEPYDIGVGAAWVFVLFEEGDGEIDLAEIRFRING